MTRLITLAHLTTQQSNLPLATLPGGKYCGGNTAERDAMAKIIIDLDLAGSGQRVPKHSSTAVESIIRRDALSQVLGKLTFLLKEDEAERDDPRSRRPLALNVMAHRRHEAILVSARRGDGKTTFLTDILRLIEGGRSKYLPYMMKETKESEVATLYSLGIIDPTLIESKQNIVVIVIEKLKAAVDRGYRLNESEKQGKYEDFKRALHELATGLTLLDGIGDSVLYGKDWADADYVLERGLDKARSAAAFERAFHRYVEEASKFLQMDAFVLAIDDVDTSFDRGWPVLEALRKYFATPRLRVLMAGDLRLYTLLVRQQQWKQIGKKFFDIEQNVGNISSYSDQLVTMVDLLQDQYLVKIVRPENRIELPPLLHLAGGEGIAFRAPWSGSLSEIDEEVVTNNFTRHLLITEAFEDRALIRATLLRLPLRSGLQIIAGAWDLVNSNAQPLDQDRERAIGVLGQVASASLMGLDLNEYELDDPRSGRVLAALVQWLTRKNLWLSMSRFHPGGMDETKDLVSVRLAARLVELFRREPRAMIDFWLRLCVIREKLDRSEISSIREGSAGGRSKDADTADLRDLILHLKADRTEYTTQFVSRLAAWEAEQGRQLGRRIRLSGASVPSVRLREADAASFELYGIRGKEFKRDVFRKVVQSKNQDLKKVLLDALPTPLREYHKKLMDASWSYLSRRGTEAGFIATFANTLSSLRDGLDGQASSVAMLPAFGITSGQASVNGGYSVLRLIATIADVLNVENATREEGGIQRFENLIQTLAQFRSYPAPSLFGVDDQSEDLDEAEEEGHNSNSDAEEDAGKASQLSSMLSAWSRSPNLAGQSIAVAPVTLARIWTRFSYAFDDIVAGLRHTKTRYLGVLMHRSITAFLHAVGVEALRAAGRTPSKKAIGNPITSSFAFFELLTALDAFKDVQNDPNLNFFRTIFSCPIWGFFLARFGSDISDQSDPRNATNEVFKRYIDAVYNVAGQKPDYSVEFRRGETTAHFDGLYFLLNSVQLQGFSQPGQKTTANGGVLLDKVLASLEKSLQQSPSKPRPSPTSISDN